MRHLTLPVGLKPAFLLLLAAVCAVLTSCSGDGFGKPPNPPRLIVVLDPTNQVGAVDAPLNLLIDTPLTFRVSVEALNSAGATDTTFNRYVRISAKPGAIAPLVGPDTDGRNILLKAGKSAPFDVNVTNAFGTTYILADDLGYTPKDPLSNPPPQCSDGIDNNHNGKIDFPADEGCAFANDDSEDGGTYSQGASTPIFFRLPRISEIRGLKCDPSLGCSGNGATPYPREQISVDTGFRDNVNAFVFNTVVTRIASDGFYVTDLDDPSGTPGNPGGFNSVFAFNFNAPPQMRTCDRLKSYGGTASEFFGFTQISYPTWTLEEWDPAQRPCLVPTPVLLKLAFLSSTPDLLKRSANLVRVETSPDGAQHVKVTPKFGPGDVQKDVVSGAYVATPDASNCDFDHNGKIVFAAGNPEGTCSSACTADPECTEWSNWIARSTFRLTVSEANGSKGAIQANATAATGFDPVAMKGIELRYVAGTMSFFSGGAQFTIDVRCKDDIIVNLQEAPFIADSVCIVDDDCSPAHGVPAGFQCLMLGGGAKACRKIDPARPDVKEPPPLACVFPRTFLDSNPQ